MSDYHTDSPVVFCIFNRPETTRRVFEQIARARPPALHIVADAPRSNNPDDVELCQTTRQIAENVTWDCDVTLDYAETNLGCRERIYSGISNAFKQFEFAIILEDDCLPSNDFFRFIDTLRNRYSEDPKVTHISGTALVRPNNPEFSYYRSSFPIIWGWATWRKHWKTFDLKMPEWPKQKALLQQNSQPSIGALDRLIKRMEETYRGSISTWDYPYVSHTFKLNGHCLSPTYNLVQNLGFGVDSTRTANAYSAQANIPFDKLPAKILGYSDNRIKVNYSNLQVVNSLYRPKKYLRIFYTICRSLNLPYRAELPKPSPQEQRSTRPLINLSQNA